MKRIIYILIAVFAFSIGVVSTVYYRLKSEPMSPFNCSWSERVSGKAGYDIYNTKSSFGEEVDFITNLLHQKQRAICFSLIQKEMNLLKRVLN